MSQVFDAAVPIMGTHVAPDEIRNNFLAIASNFSGASAPVTTSALIGQNWFDTVANYLKVYRGGSAFVSQATDQPHGDMADLDQDHHTQYLLANGAREAAGLTISAGGKVDKVDISTFNDGAATFESLLRNGSFETFDATLMATPPVWNLVGAPTFAVDTPSSGDAGQSLKITTASANEGVAQIIEVQPDKLYTLATYVKASFGNEAKVVVETSITGATWTIISSNAYTDTTFARKIVELAPGSITYLRVKLLSGSAIGSAWFDEVTLNAGQIAAYPKLVNASPDSYVRITGHQTTAPANRRTGNVRIENGIASFSLAAVERSVVGVTFPRAFSQFLLALASLRTTTSAAVLVSAIAGTTVGMSLEFRSVDGTPISAVGESDWVALGLDTDQ